MKWLLIPMFFLSFGVLADELPAKPNCRFSKMIGEHHSISVKNCSEKYCSHLLVCGKQAVAVVCKARNGECTGYSANDCYDNRIADKAEYE